MRESKETSSPQDLTESVTCGQFISLTGMEVEAFDELHQAYQKQWNKYIKAYTVAGEKRTRAHRQRKDGVLEQTQDQLSEGH